MRLVIFTFIISALALYVSSCANQGTPTGGPRDTIPPILVNTSPLNKSTNYKSQEFTLTFDEYVSADQIKSKLVITPRFENQFTFRLKKTSITLFFDEPFEDSTTYTLNFADGISDITEKNPAVNLSLAFSTGPTIDSMFIAGTVSNLYTNEKEKEILIALFDSTDTLDIFTGKPKYFTTTTEAGSFRIENIKDGLYKLYAFHDDNSNLQNEVKEESHGFLSEYIDLTTPKDSISIRIQLIDSSPLKLVRSKTTGKYFDIQYSKYISDYSITCTDSTKLNSIPAYNLISDNETVRFYPNIPNLINNDSLQVIIQAQDSLSNSHVDTLYIQFKESSRKAEAFTYTQSPKHRSNIFQNFAWTFKFNKPIKTTLQDSIRIKYDSLLDSSIPDSLFTWNTNNTQLTIPYTPDPKYLPSQFDTLYKQFQVDSVKVLTELSDSLQQVFFRTSPRPFKNIISLYLGQSAFISIEDDSTKSKTLDYAFPSETDFGVVSGTINTTYTHFQLQLIDPEFKIIDRIDNTTNFKFENVEPGKYTFRVLIDANADGYWHPGNILENIMPEPIWFYDQSFDLRANWQVENIELTF